MSQSESAQSREQTRPGLLRRIGAVLAGAVLILGFLLGMGAAWFAATWFPFALSAALVGTGGILRLRWAPWGSPRLRTSLRVSAALLATVGILGLGHFVLGHALRPQGVVQSRYVAIDWRGRAACLANVVPEADAMSLSVKLSALLGYWPPDRVREVWGLARAEYRRMAETPGFAHAGNVVVLSEASDRTCHLFRYVPYSSPGGGRPLLLFLHGAGGNLTLYLWLWSRFAEQNGVVVVCPTWRDGAWWQPGGIEVVRRALRDAIATGGIDPKRVYLAGHSNGAEGGWAVLRACPGTFRGFIAISSLEGPPDAAPNTMFPPVLLIQGGKDLPVGLARQRPAFDRVDCVVFPEDDHFVLLRSMPRVAETVSHWIRKVEEHPIW